MTKTGLFISDNVLLDSGKKLEEVIASKVESLGIKIPIIETVRNARRHRWEIFISEGE